jgi:hypothetical protein
MKRVHWVMIISLIILIILILSLWGYTHTSMKRNTSKCFFDSQCGPVLNTCGCENVCGNNYYFSTCARACNIDEIDTTINSCECVDRECVAE